MKAMKTLMTATFLSALVSLSPGAWAQDVEVNADAWNALSDDDKAAIEELLEAAGLAPGVLLPEGAEIAPSQEAAAP